jgi:hypothetical protein
MRTALKGELKDSFAEIAVAGVRCATLCAECGGDGRELDLRSISAALM